MRSVHTVLLAFAFTFAAAAPPHPRLSSTARPVPDTALECALRHVLLDVSVARVPWLADASLRVAAALRLGECGGVVSRASAPATLRPTTPHRTPAHVFVDSTSGSDAADGRSSSAALRSLPRAREVARSLRAAGVKGTLIIEVAGTHHLTAPLTLDTPLDAHTTWRGAPSGAVISGGIPFTPSWAPSSRYPAPILEAALPPSIPVEFFSLFDGATARRLPLAREPNGDAETDMQPRGWALARGNVNGTLPPPTPQGSMRHAEVGPPRNLSSFPIWGRDFDPRNVPAGYVWYGEAGGVAGWFEGGFSYWANKTIEGGLRWNATGGVDPHSGLVANAFNASTWARTAPGERRAHVFHNGLWGNWVYDVAEIDSMSQTMTFLRGGTQEARGGGIGTQPFFVEGAAEALDAPAEWWVDRAQRLIHHFPNDTAAPPTTLIVPLLETLVVIAASAPSVTLQGLTFAHTIDALMEPYRIPAAGDWSLRRSGAVVIDGAAHTSVRGCVWKRVNANALLVTGAASDTTVDACDFFLPGGSGIAVVGYVPRANVSDPAAATPNGVSITSSFFEGVGVYGKQTSALFVSLAHNVSIEGCVGFSGPRAGININDGHMGQHVIKGNVLFDWVRETQDHGAINTWDRQLYVNSDGSLAAGWVYISGNAIWNGPSANRDLGNLWPGVDNDDGSQKYVIERNLLLYGGMKNYLGQNKKWVNNLLVFPDRWAGDPCLTQWGGEEHVYANNECIVQTESPQFFTASVLGDKCLFDYTNASIAAFLPLTHGNIYHTPGGTFTQGCDTQYSLAQLQAVGQEVGSVVIKGYDVAAVVATARALLGV